MTHSRVETKIFACILLSALFQPHASFSQAQGTDASPSLSAAENAKLIQESIIPNSYIVVISSAAPIHSARQPEADTKRVIKLLHKKYKFKVTASYAYAIKGFAAKMDAATAERMSRDSLIAMLEPDRVTQLHTQTLPTGVDRIGGVGSSTITGNGSGSTSGVDIFILDTGIDVAHPDLNVKGGKNFVLSGAVGIPAWQDQNGHGTHVAGIAAALDNASEVVGVAPGANLYAARVFGANGSGSVQDMLAGVDWVTSVWLKRQRYCPVKEITDIPSGKIAAQPKIIERCIPIVANISGGSYVGTLTYSALDLAVKNSVQAGVFYSISAGNGVSGTTLSAKWFSPAHVTEAVTVGSYDPLTNIFSTFSNWGYMVDVLAPGASILSTTLGGGTISLSGTSMSAPHVAGTAALYLSKHGFKPPQMTWSALQQSALTPKSGYPNPNISGTVFSTTNTSIYSGNF